MVRRRSTHHRRHAGLPARQKPPPASSLAMDEERPLAKRFTQYSPYTIHMRSSNEAQSRHAKYRATLFKDPNTARTEAEEAVLDEELDTTWIAALNAPEQVSDETTSQGEGEEDASGSEGEGECASGSEMELEDTAASEVEEDTAMEMEKAAGKVVDAAGMLLGAAHTMDENPWSARLRKTEQRAAYQVNQQDDKTARRNRAIEYLKKRWGPDVNTWVPADTPYTDEKFQNLSRWPGGVLEELAELARLTTSSYKRQQAMRFLGEAVWDRVSKTPKYVCKNEVTVAIQKAQKVWGPVSNAQSGGDAVELVPCQHPVSQQDTSGKEQDTSAEEEEDFDVDDDIDEMDFWTLRLELTKARKRLRQLEQSQAKQRASDSA
ncbi:uncharacterized protein LTHEOB_2701 [Lasiodiplodia theobromae]|uniref:uncharacterized protein n=1 Tax=Lasiodiplodia theobromae TaxID=45133 RepID=UPI0015C2C2CA|nr:uncharacterized protein LTHEOB_2701 [Lasiodiplodia theobromae]KAF4534726.1 hypothetical protein LTHEOB_2701 [Lasiodiplodia theobromae]